MKAKRKFHPKDQLNRNCKCGKRLKLTVANYNEGHFEYNCSSCNKEFELNNNVFSEKEDIESKIRANPRFYRWSQNSEYKAMAKKILAEEKNK